MPGMENFAPERTLTSKGLYGAAESLTLQFFQLGESFVHLLIDLGRRLSGAHVLATRLSLNSEAGRNGQLGIGHLGEPCAFAAEVVFHFAVAFGVVVAEKVDILHSFRAGGCHFFCLNR